MQPDIIHLLVEKTDFSNMLTLGASHPDAVAPTGFHVKTIKSTYPAQEPPLRMFDRYSNRQHLIISGPSDANPPQQSLNGITATFRRCTGATPKITIQQQLLPCHPFEAAAISSSFSDDLRRTARSFNWGWSLQGAVECNAIFRRFEQLQDLHVSSSPAPGCMWDPQLPPGLNKFTISGPGSFARGRKQQFLMGAGLVQAWLSSMPQPLHTGAVSLGNVAFSSSTSLQELYISNSAVANVAALGALHQLKTLHLTDCTVYLGTANNLTYHRAHVLPDSLQYLSSLQQLTSLAVTDCAVNNLAAWQVLASLTKLKQLSLGSITITSTQALSSVTSLQLSGELQLFLPPAATAGPAAGVISDGSADKLLPALEHLQCNSSSQPLTASQPASSLGLSLRGHQQLRSLSVNCSREHDWGYSHLKTIPNLHHAKLLQLRGGAAAEPLKSLGACGRLRSVHLALAQAQRSLFGPFDNGKVSIRDLGRLAAGDASGTLEEVTVSGSQESYSLKDVMDMMGRAPEFPGGATCNLLGTLARCNLPLAADARKVLWQLQQAQQVASSGGSWAKHQSQQKEKPADMPADSVLLGAAVQLARADTCALPADCTLSDPVLWKLLAASQRLRHLSLGSICLQSPIPLPQLESLTLAGHLLCASKAHGRNKRGYGYSSSARFGMADAARRLFPALLRLSCQFVSWDHLVDSLHSHSTLQHVHASIRQADIDSPPPQVEKSSTLGLAELRSMHLTGVAVRSPDNIIAALKDSTQLQELQVQLLSAAEANKRLSGTWPDGPWPTGTSYSFADGFLNIRFPAIAGSSRQPYSWQDDGTWELGQWWSGVTKSVPVGYREPARLAAPARPAAFKIHRFAAGAQFTAAALAQLHQFEQLTILVLDTAGDTASLLRL